MTMRFFKTKTIQTKSAMCLLLAILCAGFPAANVMADQYDDQINAIKVQVRQFQDQAAQLHSQADTLQNQISSVTAQQSAVRAQIIGTQVHLGQLNFKIQQTQTQIENQKTALAINLRSVYLESEISPLEMVASSNSISDFIDKQQYRNSLRDHIQSSLKQVKDLKIQLDKQKIDTEQTLADQKGMQTQLSSQEQQENDLLSKTQSQESNYQQLVTQNKAKIDELRAEQVAANLKWSGGNVNFQPRGGGYPSFWADIKLDSTSDDWGMFNRECVSYAAFRVASSGRHMPYWGGVGNASQWPGNARAAGIEVGGSPRRGDIAIWPVGFYGHAMYVESVNSDGSIIISEYNYDWTGRYSQRMITQSTIVSQGFQFIHF